jgi:hypothetical protein
VTSGFQTWRAFRTLRGLAPRRDEAEHCGLCGQVLGPRHDHLVDPRTRRPICSCQACAILFDNPAAQYKRVPRDIRFLEGYEIAEGEWESLGIPIGIAFFMQQSLSDGGLRLTAYYPSPAGPVESLLPLGPSAILEQLQPDVEALLVNRAARECFVLPIDECYRLVGLMRSYWKGLSGGGEVWREIQVFFEEMKRRSVEVSHA